jgi:hypothetical protein
VGYSIPWIFPFFTTINIYHLISINRKVE